MLQFTKTVLCEEIVIDNLQERKYHYIPVMKEIFIFDNCPLETLKQLLKKRKNSEYIFISAEIYKHYEHYNRIFFFDATKYIDICSEIDRKKRSKYNRITKSTNECDILYDILYEHHIYIDVEQMNTEESTMSHLNLINLLMENYKINVNGEYNDDIKIWNNKPILDVYLSEDFTCTVERIFNRIEVDLLYPMCVLFSRDKIFVKVFKNLKSYYDSEVDIKSKILKRGDQGYLRNHIILYKLVKVDEVRKHNDCENKCMSWALTKVIYIELAVNNRIKVQFQSDKTLEHFSGPTQILQFLKIPSEKMIYMKEVQYTGSHRINGKYLVDKYKLSLFQIVKYFLDYVSLDLLTKYFFEVQNLAQVQHKEEEEEESKLVFTLNMFFFKNERVFKKHIDCRYDEVIFLNTHADNNNETTTSEKKYSAVQKTRNSNRYKYLGFHSKGSVRAKIIVNEEEIEFCFKYSLSRKQCYQFIFLFMRSLETIINREYFYIQDSDHELFKMKIRDLQSISIPTSKKPEEIADQMPYDRTKEPTEMTGMTVTTVKTTSNQSLEYNEKEIYIHDNDDAAPYSEEDDISQCKMILKFFNYSRYCDKKRIPLFSFRKPTCCNSNKIYRWPPLKYFNEETKEVFIKSVKYKEPLQLKWNGEEDEDTARFTLVIGDNKLFQCQKTNKWISNLVSVDFRFIYFYTTNDDARYLSVTPLAPGWLPSLTKKDKTHINIKTTTNYIRKSSEIIDPRVSKFLSSLFIQETKEGFQHTATFVTDYKKTLLEIIEEYDDVDNSLLTNISNDTLKFFEIQQEDSLQYSNIQYIYNTMCHLLQSNIIIIHLSDKKSDLPRFKSILDPSIFQTVNYERFSILLETLDERNKSSTLSYHYQLVKLRLNDNNQYVNAFNESINRFFYDDLGSIYHNTICKKQHMIPKCYYDFMNDDDISYQVIDGDGYARYFVFSDRIISVNCNQGLICVSCPSRKNIDFSELDTMENGNVLTSECHLLYENIFVTKQQIGPNGMWYNVVFKKASDDNNFSSKKEAIHIKWVNDLLSEIQYYDIEKNESIFYFEKYYRHGQDHARQMNTLFRKIKEDVIFNKDTSLEELIQKYVEFVDSPPPQKNSKKNKKIRIEKKYENDFKYQLKWFMQRDLSEDCFEIYNLFNYSFDFTKKKDTYVYEVGSNQN